MKQLSKLLILLIVALLGVASCGSDEPEGKWDKMKWTNVNDLKNVQGVYILPEEGGSFTFLCRNYDRPWFSMAVGHETDFSGEWYSAKFEGNKMIVTVEALPQNVEMRDFSLQVTAGDIFDTFLFRQQKGAY